MSDDEAPPAKIRKASDKQMAGLRKGMEALKTPAKEVVVEKVVEKAVEKVVHKDRVVTGSEMLNAIFNLK